MPTVYGKVCVRHPELGGARRAEKRDCIGCTRDSIRAYNASPRGVARNRAFKDRLREEGARKRAERKALTVEQRRIARENDRQERLKRRAERKAATARKRKGRKRARLLRAREECDYGYLGARKLLRYPPPRATRIELQAKWKLEGPYCGLTGMAITPGVRPSIDHIVSVADGGSSTIENLHWVHPMANWAKNKYSVEEFEAWLLASAAALLRRKRFGRFSWEALTDSTAEESAIS